MITDHRFVGRREWGLIAPADKPCQHRATPGGDVCGWPKSHHYVAPVTLADGREVPAAAVAALDDLDRRWPGATFGPARPAIAAAVLEAVEAARHG